MHVLTRKSLILNALHVILSEEQRRKKNQQGRETNEKKNIKLLTYFQIHMNLIKYLRAVEE